MKILKLVTIFIILLSLISCEQLLNQNKANFEILLDKSSYQQDENIVSTLELKNTGSNTITVDIFSLDYGSIHLYLTDPNGENFTPGGFTVIPGYPPQQNINSGESMTDNITISEISWYKSGEASSDTFKNTGTYTIRATYATRGDLSGSGFESEKNFTIE